MKYLGTMNKTVSLQNGIFKENKFKRSSRIERNMLSRNNICGKSNLFF